MEVMEVAKLAQNSHKFVCEVCDYRCSRSNDMLKHEATDKHKHSVDGSNRIKMEVKTRIKKYDCICSKHYKTTGGLWKHKQKCTYQTDVSNTSLICYANPNQFSLFDDDDDDNNNSPDNEFNIRYSSTPSENMIISNHVIAKYNNSISKHENDINQLTQLVIEVVKNNGELQKQMFDMCKNIQSTIISNTNCNNTTNNFNLQVFLNEHCKDAMNIGEFIDSFDLQISDLENVGRVGYIEGMSNIIINKIKELDVSRRPIHCSDLKREIIYIKDADVWEREDANNTKFRKVIGKVMRKNIGMLSGWRDKYPDCMDIESEYNDIYMKLTKEAMGPDDTIDSENKIMKKIYKHLVIDKKALANSGF